MKKNLFIQSTLILLIGSVITRVLGFAIKIVYTRLLSSESLNLYMLLLPTYSLFVTLASLGLPLAVSKIVSEESQRGIKIFTSLFPFIIFLNILFIIVIIVLANFISNTLLHTASTKILIIAMSFVLPFISISSLIRGYFFGKQKMFPHTLSNIIEQIVRLVLIILIIPPLSKISNVIAVMGLILLSIASEITSIIIFIIFLPKNFSITKKDLKPDIATIKDVFKISLPSISSRIIGNIGYFFEPIIITNLLIFSGYSKNFILSEYASYNAYSLSLLLIPSFFISAISTALVPEISKYYYQKNKDMVKRRIKQGCIYSFLIGLVINIIIFIFAKDILHILYGTAKGLNYFKVLSPFFLLFYLEGPLASGLQAMNKASTAFKITTYGIVIKIIVLAICSLIHIGLYGLVISEIVNIIFVVFGNYNNIKKVLN